jgi:hypothetical protein
LDVGVALGDLDARLAEAVSQGRHGEFLYTTSRTPERIARGVA